MHELKMANFEAFRQAQNSFFRGVWALGLILSKTQSLTLNSLKLYFITLKKVEEIMVPN